MTGKQAAPWELEPPVIAEAHTDGDACDAIDRADTVALLAPALPAAKVTGPLWRFKRLHKGDDFDDPTETEFFQDGGLARALVRETIQNALDAERSEETPVCVRLRLGRTMTTDLPAWMLDGLDPHLRATKSVEVPEEDACPWLLVEDFNTTGLTGDPYEDEPEDKGDEKNNYFFFWRNTGRTNKTNDERGSWGIGKAVYQSASRIQSFFGLTVRDSDGAKLLRGKSVLDNHRVGGERHAPRGHFGTFSVVDGEQNFALPVVDSDKLDDFEAIFDSKRANRTGLSVLVPWLDGEADNWNPATLAKSVCEQYFYPIAAGQLIVEVQDDEQVISIDRESIGEVIDKELVLDVSARTELRATLEFAEWALALERDQYVVLPEPAKLRGINWDDEFFPAEVLTPLMERFENGERIAIRCGIGVNPAKGQAQLAWFSVYLQKDDRLPTAKVAYVRRGITIPDVKSNCPAGVRAMVVVNWPALGKLLGDAENPAHTMWAPRKSRVGKRWRGAETSIRFVQRSVVETVSRLLAGTGETDTRMFAEFFSFERKREEMEQAKRQRRQRTEKPKVEVSKRARALAVSRIAGGVSVRSAMDLEGGDVVTVRTAYAVRKGNPFKRWDPRDFDMASLNVKIEAGTELERSGQRIQVKVDDPKKFAVAITGFDEHRDLEVDARRAKEPA